MDLREDPSGPPGLFNSDCFYNATGAATWVTAMALTGYVFANEVATLWITLKKLRGYLREAFSDSPTGSGTARRRTSKNGRKRKKLPRFLTTN